MDFKSYPKITRRFGLAIVTEKIDGSNGQINFVDRSTLNARDVAKVDLLSTDLLHDQICVLVGSRNRFIKPGDDNFGFAAYVKENSYELFNALGFGQHFGEWFGGKIQRGYGISEKRFALFNTYRWTDEDGSGFETSPKDFMGVPNLTVVPTLGAFELDNVHIFNEMYNELRSTGSKAVPGFDNPEGIVVYLTQFDQLVKITDAKEKPEKSKRRKHDLQPGE